MESGGSGMTLSDDLRSERAFSGEWEVFPLGGGEGVGGGMGGERDVDEEDRGDDVPPPLRG